MKKRNVAEQMFNDMIQTIKEKQDELEKAINDYTSNIPSKPVMDIMEDDDNVITKIDLPGVKKEDIKINLTEDTLEVTAKYSEEEEVEEANYIRRERRYGEMSRMTILPAKVKIEESTAKYEDGVLTITMPKLEKKESFTINVE